MGIATGVPSASVRISMTLTSTSLAAQANALKSRATLPYRHLVVAATLEEVHQVPGQACLGEPFVVENIDRFHELFHSHYWGIKKIKVIVTKGNKHLFWDNS